MGDSKSYDPTISRDKGLDAGTTATVGGAIVTVVQVGVALSQGATLTDAAATGLLSAIVTLGAASAAAIRAWWKNRKKHKPPRNSGNVPYSGLTMLLVALSLALAGCITTTAPDGTVTQQVDGVLLETMLTRYDRYVARQELLEIEREKARRANDAAMMAIVQAELDRLEPEIRALGERLGLSAPR